MRLFSARLALTSQQEVLEISQGISSSGGGHCEAEAVHVHVASGPLRIRMIAAQDPDLDTEDVLEICLGFLKTTELREGDGTYNPCSKKARVFGAEACFVIGGDLGGRFVSLLIPMQVQ